MTRLKNFAQYSVTGFTLFVLSLTPALRAAAQNDPIPLQGWEQGIELPGKAVGFSAPAIAEIDGDTSNGKEIVAAGADGLLHVYHANGTQLWSSALPIYGCSGASASNRVFSSPAVGDLFGDGVPYIVVGYGGFGGKSCGGGVVAFRRDGSRYWHFDLALYARQAHFGTNSHSVFSSPALADINGDGTLEIGFGSFNRDVYLLNALGRVMWRYNAADTVYSTPAFADVNGDGLLEMIVGTDISQNKSLRPPTPNGGYVYALNASIRGSRVSAVTTLKAKARRKKKRRKPAGQLGVTYTFRDKRLVAWSTGFDQVIQSSPAVGDIVASSPGLEIAVGAGCFFPQGSRDKRGRWVKILSLANGKLLSTMNASGCVEGSPALADLNSDGNLDVVAYANGHSDVGGDGKSRLSAWSGADGSVLWEIIPRDNGDNDEYPLRFQSPAIADIDGNGSLEVIAPNSFGVGIYQGTSGAPLTCYTRTCPEGPRLRVGRDIQTSPAIGDVNLDGVLDLIIASGTGGDAGALYGWTNFSSFLAGASGAHPAFSAPWPMFHGGASRRGVFGE